MTERFAGRLARTFGGFDRTRDELPEWEEPGDVEYDSAVQTVERWEQEPDRFPVTLHGYDRDAVDQHLDALERELAELRERAPSAETISEEIKRIGEQTAAILQVAHEQAHITRREAQAEADRCLADAASHALTITDEAHQRVRRLDSDADTVWRERARLIEDVRAVATALTAVADGAATRFPAESEKLGGGMPIRAARPALAQDEVTVDDAPEDANGFAGLA